MPVTLKDAIDPNAGVSKLIVTANTTRDFAALLNLFIRGTLKISNATDLTQPTDARNGTFEITNPSGSPAAGKFADMVFAAYLPKWPSINSGYLDVQVIGSACAVVTSSPGTVTINETCAFNIRKSRWYRKSYYLIAVGPNPVGNKGADISFSVGLKAMTELSLYRNPIASCNRCRASLEPGA